jgi:hypothetical protein
MNGIHLASTRSGRQNLQELRLINRQPVILGLQIYVRQMSISIFYALQLSLGTRFCFENLLIALSMLHSARLYSAPE